MSMRKTRSPIILLICVLLIIRAGNGALQARKGKRAPGTFFLSNLQSGKSEMLGDYFRKGPVVISFWATYCIPCAREMPELQRLLDKFPGITILFINIDKREQRTEVERLVRKWGIQQTVLLDVYQVAAKKYIPGLVVPATFLIDSTSTIRYSSIGYHEKTIPSLERALKNIK